MFCPDQSTFLIFSLQLLPPVSPYASYLMGVQFFPQPCLDFVAYGVDTLDATNWFKEVIPQLVRHIDCSQFNSLFWVAPDEKNLRGVLPGVYYKIMRYVVFWFYQTFAVSPAHTSWQTMYLNGPIRQKRVSLSRAVRGLILMAVVISGIFLVVKNLSGYTFSPDFIIFLDIGHLGTVMLYLMVALYCLVTKKDWTTALQRHMNKG